MADRLSQLSGLVDAFFGLQKVESVAYARHVLVVSILGLEARVGDLLGLCFLQKISKLISLSLIEIDVAVD